MSNLFERVFGCKLADMPASELGTDLYSLMKLCEAEEIEQMRSNKRPLQKILSEIDISGDLEEEDNCWCLTLPDGDAFRKALVKLADADNMNKLSNGGWVADTQGDVAMTNEPAEYKINFLDITEVEGGDSDTPPNLEQVIKKGREFATTEPDHDDPTNPVENPRSLKTGRQVGISKAKDGSGPEGKIKDSAQAVVNNLLETDNKTIDAPDGESQGLAKKPTARGVRGRPKKLPKELKKNKDIGESRDLPEPPPLDEMTATGSMGTVASPVGAKEMYEPGRGLETKGTGGHKLGTKFKMPGKWNQKPAIAPKPNSKKKK